MIKVMHYVSKMDRAGQETFIMNLFRNIDRRMVQFDFLCTSNGEGEYDAEIVGLGGKIEHIKLNRINGKLKQLDNMMILYNYLREKSDEYQIFHIHTQHAMDAFCSALAAKVAGVKMVIVHSHNTSTMYHMRAHKLFKAFLKMLPIERFACYVAAGNWMFGKSKFQVVNNGIDIKKFCYDSQIRQEVRNELGLNGKYVIGHVGRFNKQKNHSIIIEIFKKLHQKMPESELILVGKGELLDEIRDKIKQNNLEEFVLMLGVREDVNRLYQGMDLFLFPSYFEGLPVVLVEAQMSDLTCLISDSITREIDITSEIYRMSISTEAEKWTEKIMLLAGINRNRQDVTERIREKGYDMQSEAEKIMKFYTKALEK